VCLAIPAKIVSIDQTTATLDLEGAATTADISMVPGARAGDYVIVHAGVAIQIYDEKEAQETLRLWREMAGLSGEMQEGT
jgi:hydrogenase expression/formation protein HypC